MSDSASPLLYPPASLYNDNFSKSSTPASWHAIFEGSVEKYDPIWTAYLEEAQAFDNKQVEEWNKIIDVVLVYDALFAGVLIAFILDPATSLKPDSADIAAQLLVGIYNNQLAALQNHSLPKPINTTAIFQENRSSSAVFSNALLYVDLALALIVSVIALIAKLWLISYGREVNSSGSPYERALRRQEAYGGAVLWKLGAFVNALPLLLVGAVFLFALFIHQSILDVQITIGYLVGSMFTFLIVLMGALTIAAAFIPGCPFKSSVSDFIRSIFNIFPNYQRPPSITTFNYWKPVLALALVTAGVQGLSIFLILKYSASGFGYIGYVFACIPVALAFSTIGKTPKAATKPRKYGLSHFTYCADISISLVVFVAAYFSDVRHRVFIALFCVAGILVVGFCLIGTQLYKLTPDTREADAIAWFLKSTSLQKPKPAYFKIAGQIAEGSDARKALILDSILPLLLPLITTCHRHQEGKENPILQELETYVACLAQLSSFDDNKGSFWKNEAPVVHPGIPTSFVEILKKLQHQPPSNSCLGDAIRDILGYKWVEVEAPDVERGVA